MKGVVHLIVAIAVLVPVGDLKWHEILGRRKEEVERRLAPPVSEEVTEYTVYDPRWVKWIEDRDTRNRLVGRRIEIVWRYPDDVEHDLDLWANRVPGHVQAKNSWIRFVGAPLSRFEATAGKPLRTATYGRGQTREYFIKGLGAVSLEAYAFQTPTPIVTHLTVTLPLTAQFQPTLRALKIDGKTWKKMEPYVDPNSLAHLRYPIGKGALKEITYPYGAGERLTVRYAGLLRKETAQAFTLKSDQLKSLREGAARFGFSIPGDQIDRMEGTESYWGRARYAATFELRPEKQFTIFVRNFDPSDLN